MSLLQHVSSKEQEPRQKGFLARSNYYIDSHQPEAVGLFKEVRRGVYHILGRLTLRGEVHDGVREALLKTGVTQHATDDIQHEMGLITMDTVCSLLFTYFVIKYVLS